MMNSLNDTFVTLIYFLKQSIFLYHPVTTCFGYTFKLNIDGTNKWQIRDLKSKKTAEKLFDRVSPS